jgi:quinol-cytochrome oxidoreductase complex cytochrome b subunit
MLEYIPGIGPWFQRLIQGGSEMGPAVLSNFYALHTMVLPAVLIMLMAFHFWRIRKARGLVIPREPEEDGLEIETVDTIPNLILREVVVATVLVAALLIFAMIFDAPLAEKANPGLSPNPTKAPWYFMGFQELLIHCHPLFALLIIPALLLTALVGLPYINDPEGPSGVWFASLKGRRMAVAAVIFASIVTPALIFTDAHIIDSGLKLNRVPAVVSGGLIPFTVMVVAMTGFYLIIKKRFNADSQEIVQTMFVLILTAFIILTITGIWFRGPGMKLIWPV